MGQLTEHLGRHEFACKCGCGKDVVDIELANGLESAAEYFWRLWLRDSLLNPERHTRPDRIRIHINSGNRCVDHDQAGKRKQAEDAGLEYVYKKSTSQHLEGNAADFWLDFVMPNGEKIKVVDDEIADYLEMIHPGEHGIGRYDDRTHYDVRSDGPARWDKRSKK